MNSIDNVTPFAYLVWNFASLSTAVNVMSFKYEYITKPEPFNSQKIHLSVLLGLFTDQNDKFPYPFIQF